jgi:hypothetical protein
MPDARVIQIRRGTTVQHQTFAGAEGEITVDTDKWTVVVHDGKTIGGFPLKIEALEYVRTRYLTYRAAIVQQGIPSLGFSTPENAPTPIAVLEPTGVITGVARFDGAGTTNEFVQDHFMLPDDWVPPIELDVIWRTDANLGTVSWRVEICNVSVDDTTGAILSSADFGNPINAGTIISGVTGSITTTTIEIPADTFIPGDELFFRLTRNVGSPGNLDTVQSPVDLISLRFKLLVQGK